MGKRNILPKIKTNNVEDEAFYSDDFVEEQVFNWIYQASKTGVGLTFDWIIFDLSQKYPNITVNRKALDSFLIQFPTDKPLVPTSNNPECKEEYSLTPEQFKLGKMLENFYSLYILNSNSSHEELREKVFTYLSENFRKPDVIASLISTLDQQRNPERGIKYYLARFYNYLTEKSNFPITFDSGITEIDESSNELPVTLLVPNPIVAESLYTNNVMTIGQLSNINAYIYADTLFLVSTQVEAVLTALKGDVHTELTNYALGSTKSFSENEKTSFYKKYGIYPNLEEMTLEAIGDEQNVTRERIRQILVKADTKFFAFKSMSPLLLVLFAKDFKNSYYVGTEELLTVINNKEVVDLLRHYCSECENTVVGYDKELQVFFKKQYITSEEIPGDIVSEFPEFLTEHDIDGLTPLERRAVLIKYTKRKTGYYVLKGLRQTEQVMKVLDDTFPNGYRPYSEEDFAVLCKALVDTYGDDYTLPTQTSVRGLFTRDDTFCQTDRGTAKRRIYVAEQIPDDLLEEINNYIAIHGPVVRYLSIFDVFKKQLQALNINNQYFLKGLLDYRLDKEKYDTKRNYLKVAGVDITARENLKNYIYSQTSVFNIQNLSSMFPGVKKYTFQDCLYKDDSFLWLPDSNYVKAEYCGMSEHAKQVIHDEIVKALNNSKEGLFSARRLYSKLRIFNKDLFNEMGYIQNGYALYSYCKWAYKDEFFFRRPYISKSGDFSLNALDILYKYLKELPKFDKRVMDEYIHKMAIHHGFNFVEVAEDLSEDFVQVGPINMVRKDYFTIKDYELNDIKETVSLIVKSQGQLNGKYFTGYEMLPTIPGYRWNQYMLAGIIQSYFGDHFILERTSNNSSHYDYIIKAI